MPTQSCRCELSDEALALIQTVRGLHASVHLLHAVQSFACIHFHSALNTYINQQMNNEAVSKADRWTVARLVFPSVSGEKVLRSWARTCASDIDSPAHVILVLFFSSLLFVSGDPGLPGQPVHAHEVHGLAQVILKTTDKPAKNLPS